MSVKTLEIIFRELKFAVNLDHPTRLDEELVQTKVAGNKRQAKESDITSQKLGYIWPERSEGHAERRQSNRITEPSLKMEKVTTTTTKWEEMETNISMEKKGLYQRRIGKRNQ